MCADAVVTAATIAAASTAQTISAERYPCMAGGFYGAVAACAAATRAIGTRYGEQLT